MSTAYRWTVWTESTVEHRRGSASAHGSLVFKRDSKAALAEAMKAFYQAIRQNMPDGRNARAWLERSAPGRSPEFLVSFDDPPTRLWLLSRRTLPLRSDPLEA